MFPRLFGQSSSVCLQKPTIDKVIFKIICVSPLKLIYFITSDLGISPSRYMVLRVLTASVTVSFLSPEWKEE